MAEARQRGGIAGSLVPPSRHTIGRVSMHRTLLVAAILLAVLGPSESNSAGHGGRGLSGRCARAQREARSLAYLWVDTPTGGRIYRTDPEEQQLEVCPPPDSKHETVWIMSSVFNNTGRS